MQALNFPPYRFRISTIQGKDKIFDPVRKKLVMLTPEEWVRQNLMAYLMEDRMIPPSLIGVEKQLMINGMTKRFDVVVFNRTASPVLLVECKAPSIIITEKTFDQAARYNMQLHVNYFVITNGISHYCCRIDYNRSSYEFIEGIPSFEQLL